MPGDESEGAGKEGMPCLGGIIRWEGCCIPATGILGNGCACAGVFGPRCDRSASLKVRVAKFPSLLIVTYVAPTRSDHSILAMP
jgi:hypothetical protein